MHLNFSSKYIILGVVSDQILNDNLERRMNPTSLVGWNSLTFMLFIFVINFQVAYVSAYNKQDIYAI